jgi:hypothetical protein
MRQLRLPEPHRHGIELVASLSDQIGGELLRRLQGLGNQATGESGQTLLRSDLLGAAVEAGVPEDDAVAMIDALLALHVLRTNEGWSRQQLAQVVAESPDLTLDPSIKEGLAGRLERYLGVGAVAVISKAFDVVSNYEHVFAAARILTDPRPVFGDDPRQGLLGMVIVQTLRIDYLSSDGQAQAFYVTMDAGGVLQLKEQVERALAKAEALQDSLSQSGVPFVEPDERASTEAL